MADPGITPETPEGGAARGPEAGPQAGLDGAPITPFTAMECLTRMMGRDGEAAADEARSSWRHLSDHPGIGRMIAWSVATAPAGGPGWRCNVARNPALTEADLNTLALIYRRSLLFPHLGPAKIGGADLKNLLMNPNHGIRRLDKLSAGLDWRTRADILMGACANPNLGDDRAATLIAWLRYEAEVAPDDELDAWDASSLAALGVLLLNRSVTDLGPAIPLLEFAALTMISGPDDLHDLASTACHHYLLRTLEYGNPLPAQHGGLHAALMEHGLPSQHPVAAPGQPDTFASSQPDKSDLSLH